MSKLGSTQLFAVVLVLVVVSIFIPNWFFQRAEATWKNRRVLSLHVPKEAHGITNLNDTPAGKILSFDHSDCYMIDVGAASPDAKLYITAMKYGPGNSYLQRDVYGHSPDICLPASGAKLVTGPITKNEIVAGLPVKIERYTFSHPLHDSFLYIFKLIWIGEIDKGTDAQGPENRWESRIQMVRSSDKNPPGLVVLGVIYGAQNELVASQIFLEHVQQSCHSEAALPNR
ncbi:MAG: hypothetical protein HC845_03125 [Akkermansiaceae bacterium]|nr:hypothetical protein [Akkermansiaceae bacterium]